MNKRQKQITLAALVVFTITLFNCQWNVSATSSSLSLSHDKEVRRWTTAAPIWSPPSYGSGLDLSFKTYSLDLSSLLSRWAAIGVIWGALFALSADRKPKPPTVNG